ncbi:hypothetical protein DMA15_03640 [Streptomyces sp. WAC 01529]|uniref:hypothetical protein n=1 Tax=Streptomyces sp. WAC 01529 TaxID=2203205 RepID=UPI000F6EC6C2|nr:hypothetical protein [Streptomyces sp. WAC 01529]AZM51786.1 hypothetical protein DMA15_03640 [Streptomyces sp. WAC 01529]
MASDPEFIADLVRQLVSGWEERIEYQVPVTQHVTLCQIRRSSMPPGRRRHHECECPAAVEARARTLQLPSLIVQLQEAVTEPVSKAGGDGIGAIDRPHSNPPGNGEALALLLTIRADAHDYYDALRAVLYPGHGERKGVTVLSALRAIPDWCAMAGEAGHDDLVYGIKEDLRKRVRTARIILGYDSPMAMLADVLCGDCGGALIVAGDASTDVRCIGTPEAAPCGTKYFRWDWIKLLEDL